jgi:hypothetical protein
VSRPSKLCFAFRFPHQIPCMRFSPIRSTCPATDTLFDLITRILLGEGYRLCRSALYSLLQSPVTSPLLVPSIILRTMFSKTLGVSADEPFFIVTTPNLPPARYDPYWIVFRGCSLRCSNKEGFVWATWMVYSMFWRLEYTAWNESETYGVCRPLLRDTTFHTHVKQQAEL